MKTNKIENSMTFGAKNTYLKQAKSAASKSMRENLLSKHHEAKARYYDIKARKYQSKIEDLEEKGVDSTLLGPLKFFTNFARMVKADILRKYHDGLI